MNTSKLVNIASHLPKIARERPDAIAVYAPEGQDCQGRTRHTHLSFAQLDRDSDRIAFSLQKRGIGRGVRTVLMVKPSLDFFSVTFALFKAGAVPILIDPGMGLRNIGACLREAEPEAFIGIRKAVLAQRILGWGRKTIRTVVQVGGIGLSSRYITLNELRLDWFTQDENQQGAGEAHEECPPQLAATEAEDTAAILFTSGSTGPPKGVVYSHAIFEEQVRQLRTLYHIEPGEIDLCTFPLFALFAPALGMTSVIPEMNPTRPAQVNAWKILSAIEDFGVTNMFGSPALLNRVGLDLSKSETQLTSLKRVISAGAPVPARVLERFKTLVKPHVQIFTPYGSTEALPVCSIGSDEILAETSLGTDTGQGVCVGQPVLGMRIEIITISDDAIMSWSPTLSMPDGEIGEIVAQGAVVTSSYFHRDVADKLAKIADPQTGKSFHRMGDLGYRDARGRIWFCGRKSHRVITSSGTMYTIPCEGVFNTHPDVFRTALVGIGRPGAQRPVLCVELWPGIEISKHESIRRQLLEIGAKFNHTNDIRTLLFHKSFPVDIRHNSKIFREKLAIWAARQVR